MRDERTIRRALRRHRDELLAKKGVVIVGRGMRVASGRNTGESCVVVTVERKRPAARLRRRDLVPRYVDGVRTDVVEAGGPIKAHQNRTDRHRPAPGGVSIGHFRVTAGTLGCLVRRGAQRFMLSNNHVLANSNEAQAGDAILQPGVADGGEVGSDQIGTLEDFVPIRFDGVAPPDPPGGGGCSVAALIEFLLNWLAGLLRSSYRVGVRRAWPAQANVVDAAIALPAAQADVEPTILGIGIPTGSRDPVLGEHVTKSGRTTAVRSDVVQQVEATVRVQYGAGRIATFEDQVVTGPISQPGDSGSAVLGDDGNVVGLLFAGSDALTIFSPIRHALEAFDVEVQTG